MFTAPRGSYDLLPPDSATTLAVRAAFARQAELAGYGYIETPTFEDTGLFVRGVGESTDVVSKEMYTFDDRGGRSITLRPEGTAPVVRSVLEHNLHRGALPVKLWYSGSFFRYERPQAGRYRHFSQVGVEALGSSDPALDAEVIAAGARGYTELGLRKVQLLLNSLGDAACRPAYRAKLQEFLRGLDLDDATRARVEINPLRVLDDKRLEVTSQLGGVPTPADSLCDACRAHHEAVRGFLADLGVTYVDDPHLVRGLDYYTRTTFEFDHGGLGAQSGVGGGGRYDGLAEELGGAALPGIGYALGVDRTVLAMRAEGIPAAAGGVGVQVFLVPLSEAARGYAVRTLGKLRDVGVRSDMAYDGRGLKGAMKAAARSGASYAVVVGERDLSGGVAQLKDLATTDQIEVGLADLVTTLKEKLP